MSDRVEMDERTALVESKKWLDNIESNRKMLEFARQELDEGNILNAKAILDSLNKNLGQTAKTCPLDMRTTLQDLQRETVQTLLMLKMRFTPKKRSHQEELIN